jgi:integrase
MQAKNGSVSGSVTRQKRARGDVWELRYRLLSGKDSTKVLGKVWGGRGRPAAGYLTATQANAAAQTFLDEHADVPIDRQTFEAAREAFITRVREKGRKETTLRGYTEKSAALGARRHSRMSPTWNERLLDSFTSAEIVAVRAELLTDGRAPSTVNEYRVVVRGIFGTHKGSPALAWDWKALGTGPKDDLAFYDPSEVARLVDAADSERDAVVFALATMAGPRMSEIRGLRVGDVDFGAGLLRLVQGYTDDGGFASVKGHELRSVPMAPSLAARLRPFCEGRAPDALVFRPQRGADALCGSALYRRFIEAADVAGLRRIRFHDLRHSFGTQAIQRFDIYKVQRWLGHKSITTTEKYLHYRADADAAQAMDDLWKPQAAPDAAADEGGLRLVA